MEDIKYPELVNYYNYNEYFDTAKDIGNDIRDEQVLQHIENLFSDEREEDYRASLPTSLIRDMLQYYFKHNNKQLRVH